MAGQNGILEVLEAPLLAQEEFQDFLEPAQVDEGGGLAKDEIDEATVAFICRQALDMHEGLLQCSDGFGMGMASGRLLGKRPQILDGLSAFSLCG